MRDYDRHPDAMLPVSRSFIRWVWALFVMMQAAILAGAVFLAGSLGSWHSWMTVPPLPVALIVIIIIQERGISLAVSMLNGLKAASLAESVSPPK